MEHEIKFIISAFLPFGEGDVWEFDGFPLDLPIWPGLTLDSFRQHRYIG